MITELFGVSAADAAVDWTAVVEGRTCPFLRRECLKTRKSDPSVAIGSCSASVGKAGPTVLCPHRLLERGIIFSDALPLLQLHEAGNEIHLVREVEIPGGNVDYFLISTRERKVMDFVGIELQTLDSTGSIWPQRQEFLRAHGVSLLDEEFENSNFGLNWKMTAKTILMQLHHKLQTFENLNKKLVLVLQTPLLNYMRSNFSFGHLALPPRLGDALHFHAYDFHQRGVGFEISFEERLSTDVAGIAQCLGLNANPNIELEAMYEILAAKINDDTVFRLSS